MKETESTAFGIREALERKGFVPRFPQGVSMRPLMWQGITYVNVKPVGEPRIGDVLVFDSPGGSPDKCIMHRLIGIEGDVFVTRGDNCLGCERFTRDKIIGKATDLFWMTDGRSRFSPYFWLPRWFNAELLNGHYHITLDNKRYLLYVRFWSQTWPLRRLYFRLRGFAARLYHSFRAV